MEVSPFSDYSFMQTDPSIMKKILFETKSSFMSSSSGRKTSFSKLLEIQLISYSSNSEKKGTFINKSFLRKLLMSFWMPEEKLFRRSILCELAFQE